jgi:hypothetical protein
MSKKTSVIVIAAGPDFFMVPFLLAHSLPLR